MPQSPRGIVPKTPDEIDAMAASGAVLAEAHEALAAEVAPGVTTAHLDAVAEELIRSRGGIPAFKDYPGPTPYPASICTSTPSRRSQRTSRAARPRATSDASCRRRPSTR